MNQFVLMSKSLTTNTRLVCSTVRRGKLLKRRCITMVGQNAYTLQYGVQHPVCCTEPTNMYIYDLPNCNSTSIIMKVRTSYNDDSEGWLATSPTNRVGNLTYQLTVSSPGVVRILCTSTLETLIYFLSHQQNCHHFYYNSSFTAVVSSSSRVSVSLHCCLYPYLAYSASS